MARKLRVQYPGAIYHFLNRGNRHTARTHTMPPETCSPSRMDGAKPPPGLTPPKAGSLPRNILAKPLPTWFRARGGHGRGRVQAHNGRHPARRCHFAAVGQHGPQLPG
jgi:hypothetical protein